MTPAGVLAAICAFDQAAADLASYATLATAPESELAAFIIARGQAGDGYEEGAAGPAIEGLTRMARARRALHQALVNAQPEVDPGLRRAAADRLERTGEQSVAPALLGARRLLEIFLAGQAMGDLSALRKNMAALRDFAQASLARLDRQARIRAQAETALACVLEAPRLDELQRQLRALTSACERLVKAIPSIPGIPGQEAED